MYQKTLQITDHKVHSEIIACSESEILHTMHSTTACFSATFQSQRFFHFLYKYKGKKTNTNELLVIKNVDFRWIHFCK